MKPDILKELRKVLAPGQIIENAVMKDYTSFRVGGEAPLIVEPGCAKEICSVVDIFNNYGILYRVLGNGTNVLVMDEGLSCPIIHIGKNMSHISRFENCITAEGGAKLSAVARYAMENSLAGLEFASGIPGNVGGGVIMNAGAYDGEMKDVVEAVSFVGPDGKEYAVGSDEMEFGYRHSALLDSGCIVTAVSFMLRRGNKEEISEKMKELNQRRRDKQPLEYPSAGSTFKRPKGYYAGTLIEEAGLKGCQIGGAAVSDKHAGFVINKENATAADILNVIDHVQRTVYAKNGVLLEPEVRIWGKDK